MRGRRGGSWKGHGRAGHNGKSYERREVIGGGRNSGEGSRDSREVIGGEGILGKKSEGEWGKRGGEVCVG